MCGIAGIINQRHDVQIADIKKMTDIIYHRGPDGEGVWINPDKTVGLGHRRLAIIDLSEAGKQPMASFDQNLVITFNGEIYNYLELRSSLKTLGYSFISNSDTEVLIYLYQEHGSEMLSHLNGMFSFAIWDEKDQTLFCARDRFGEKPFFYTELNDRFFFSSEMKQLWAAGIPKEVDENTKTNYILHEIPLNSKNLFYKHIKELKAGHYLVLKEGNVEIQSYWSLNHVSPNSTIGIKEAAEEFKNLLTNSVQLRLRSDVAVGSSLSGGLDSSSIVCLIDQLKLKNQYQNTFSARFKNFEKDEGKFMKLVIEQCPSVKSFETYPAQNDILDNLEKVCFHQELPFESSSILAQWAVMKLAKDNNTTVLLDGQGADEYLAGYMFTYKTYLYQLFQEDRKKYEEEFAYYQQYHGTTRPLANFKDSENLKMKIGRLKNRLLRKQAHSNDLKQSLKKQMFESSLPRLLRFADRNSMAHSREVRLPFLDHKLVEFCYSLPDEYLLRNGWTKYILREAMNGQIPDKITWRTDKIGYAPPQKSWMDNPELKDIIYQEKTYYSSLLNKSPFLERGLEWRLLMAHFFN